MTLSLRPLQWWEQPDIDPMQMKQKYHEDSNLKVWKYNNIPLQRASRKQTQAQMILTRKKMRQREKNWTPGATDLKKSNFMTS